MYQSEYANKAALKSFNKLIGNDSDELIYMSRDVIRSVVKGILLGGVILAVMYRMYDHWVNIPNKNV